MLQYLRMINFLFVIKNLPTPVQQVQIPIVREICEGVFEKYEKEIIEIEEGLCVGR